jgi:hypothetical protein
MDCIFAHLLAGPAAINFNITGLGLLMVPTLIIAAAMAVPAVPLVTDRVIRALAGRSCATIVIVRIVTGRVVGALAGGLRATVVIVRVVTGRVVGTVAGGTHSAAVVVGLVSAVVLVPPRQSVNLGPVVVHGFMRDVRKRAET